LVPLDGSEHSLRALETAIQETAIQIAKKFDAKITLLHVYSVTATPVIMPEPTTLMPSGMPVMTPSEVAKIVEMAREVGRGILTDGKQKVESENIEVETVLKEGNTVQEITEFAREAKSDLIVMGLKGIGRLRELLVGSVSEGVVKQAPCPVLIVK
jgi:nucleotide-binding universal stress UspA family protein